MRGAKGEALAFTRGLVAAALMMVADAGRASDPPIRAGDCNGDGEVSITEVQKCANVFFFPTGALCAACDIDGDGNLDISELQGVVNCYLDGDATNCPYLSTGVCGDGEARGEEECDDGAVCTSGSMIGAACDTDVDCPGGGYRSCVPVGGDGCDSNCTLERDVIFTFTGATCRGGAKHDQACRFLSFCSGPARSGRPCASSADCGGSSCVTECGGDSRGCFGDGECAADGVSADDPALQCPVLPSGTPALVCAGGPAAGLPCISAVDCGGSSCANPCGTGSCLHRSRALSVSSPVVLPLGPLSGHEVLRFGKPLGSSGLIFVTVPANGLHFDPVPVPGLVCACLEPVSAFDGVGNVGSGIISCGVALIENDVTIAVDHSTAPPRRCVGGTNAGSACTPRCATGGANGGLPCRIPGINPTECPGSGAQRLCAQNADCPAGTCTLSNGPGICGANSDNAGRACFDNSQCRGSGARCQGRCVAGANVGSACSCSAGSSCSNGTECGAGGICAVTGSLGGGLCAGPPKFCDGGTTAGKACFNDSECGAGGICRRVGGAAAGKFLAWCDQHVDCPGSICNGIDDPGCDDVAPLPPVDSGSAACRESRTICIGGHSPGQVCTSHGQCGSGGSCGNACNPSGLHPGACNGPRTITFDGSGGRGSAVLSATLAIGYVGGTCGYAAVCAGGSANGNGCVVDADCPGGLCASATCGGFCSGGSPPAAPCRGNVDCSGNGTCTGGSAFGTRCTVAGPCGVNGVCLPVDRGKGVDGLPCTSDDARTIWSPPQVVVQTTGRTTSLIADANHAAGGQLVHLACAGGSINPASCSTSAVGVPFDCDRLTSANPSVSGARLATTATIIDGPLGDEVLSILLRAR